MKKISCMLLLLLLTCSLLGGCSNVEAPSSEPDLIVVGVSQVGAESDWRVANTESMKAVFTEQNGYRLLFDDARQKQENQIIAVRKFIQQQVDYIVLMPLSEIGWDSVLQEAKDAGIPVIVMDRMVNVSDESLYAVHIGSDFEKEGKMAVKWMERYAMRTQKSSLNIVHVQGTPGSTAQIQRTAALEAALSENANWSCLAQLDGDFTQAKTYEVMTEYLKNQDPSIALDVVYCENDNEAFGAMQALEEAGYQCGIGGVAIVCFDATRLALTACLEGKINFVVECNPLLGPLAAQAIQELEAGKTPEKWQYVQEQCFEKGDLTVDLIEKRAY